MMSLTEKKAISNYKSYSNKYLISYEYLADYWVPEFDSSNVYDDENERLDALIMYLDNLKLYYKHIKKYAELRQYHYKTFIFNIKEEDIGHNFWRKALNSVVIDSKEKLVRWESVKNNTFDYFSKVYSETEFPNISVVNVDYYSSNDKENIGKVSININKKEANMRNNILRKQIKQENIKALTEAINIRQKFNSNISSLYMKKFKVKDYYVRKDEKEYFYSLFSKYYFEPHHFLTGTDAELKELFNKVIMSKDNDEWSNPYLLCTDIRIINLCIIRAFTVLDLTFKINKSLEYNINLYSFLREIFVIFTMNENYFLKALDNLEEVGMPKKLINDMIIEKIKYIFGILLPVNKRFVANYRIWSLYLYLEKPFEQMKKLYNITTSINHLTNYIKEKFPSYLSKQIYNIRNKRNFKIFRKYSFVKSDIDWIYNSYNVLYEDVKEHKNNIQKMLENIDYKIERNERLNKLGEVITGVTVVLSEPGKITIDMAGMSVVVVEK